MKRSERIKLAKHGIDFLDAGIFFGGQFLVLEDYREDYGEERFLAFGSVHGRSVVVSFPQRDGKTRIISMRKANRREQEKYKKEIADRLGKGLIFFQTARIARAVAPGMPHHVTQRGNRRQQTFLLMRPIRPTWN